MYPPSPYISLQKDTAFGRTVVWLSFSGRQEWLVAVKTIAGARYAPIQKTWYMPYTKEAFAQFQKLGIPYQIHSLDTDHTGTATSASDQSDNASIDTCGTNSSEVSPAVHPSYHACKGTDIHPHTGGPQVSYHAEYFTVETAYDPEVLKGPRLGTAVLFEKTAISGRALEGRFRSEEVCFRRQGDGMRAKRKAWKCERSAVAEQSPFFQTRLCRWKIPHLTWFLSAYYLLILQLFFRRSAAMPQKNELRLSKNTLRQSLKPMKYFPSILVTFLRQWEKSKKARAQKITESISHANQLAREIRNVEKSRSIGMFEKTAISGRALEWRFRSEEVCFRRQGDGMRAKRKAWKCERSAVAEQSPFFQTRPFLVTFLRQWEKSNKPFLTATHLQDGGKDRYLSILSNQQLKGENLKHTTMLYTLYSTGMRLNEILHLRVQDLWWDRDQILIKGGKGKKDRIVPLSTVLKQLFIQYFEAYKPAYWLFEGQDQQRHYAERSLQLVVQRAAKQAGISKRVTPHTLRHCFATHLLDGGIDVRYIQELLGHSHINTTLIYTHVTNAQLSKVETPLDKLMRHRQEINATTNFEKKLKIVKSL